MSAASSAAVQAVISLPSLAAYGRRASGPLAGARAGDAQIRVSPARPRDPFLRQLR